VLPAEAIADLDGRGRVGVAKARALHVDGDESPRAILGGGGRVGRVEASNVWLDGARRPRPAREANAAAYRDRWGCYSRSNGLRRTDITRAGYSKRARDIPRVTLSSRSNNNKQYIYRRQVSRTRGQCSRHKCCCRLGPPSRRRKHTARRHSYHGRHTLTSCHQCHRRSGTFGAAARRCR